MLVLLVTSMLALAFNVRLVQAQAETVYINSDGSVSPSDAPISSVDNVTYTFTGNINYPAYYGVVVERNNIIIDGNGYTVQGPQSGSGISLTDISNVTIENANVENVYFGIWLESSSNNTVSKNNVTANSGDGIFLDSSGDVLSDNNVTANSIDGIFLYSSSGDVLSDNNVALNSFDGIYLDSSSNNNTVSGNNVVANNGEGIEIDSSSGNVLSDSVIEDNKYNFGVSGSVLGDFMNSVDTSNLVDGKPIYYITSKSNLVITPQNYPSIGYMAIVNCTNTTVQGLTLTNDGEGILLAFTNGSKITNNNVTNNGDGIYLYSCSSDTVSGNNATANSSGILLEGSADNIVSGNDAIANSLIGIYIEDSSNDDTVGGNNVTANASGIYLYSSSSNAVSCNNATANGVGIHLYSSSNNTVSGNDVAANSVYGIGLTNSSGNIMYHNSFVGNDVQAFVGYINPSEPTNTWDDGYPSGGNYWSDYNGTDLYSGPYQNETGSDGIGDTPYAIVSLDFMNNLRSNTTDIDHYPLMGPFSDFTVAAGVDVQVVSNSTVSDFQFNGTAILFNVSGASGTTGFCNVRVPTSLLNGTLSVFVNGTQVQYSLLPSLNSSVSYIYFTYGHSTEQVAILPEFPGSLILAILTLATLLPIGIHKKRHSRS
jgi:parallel beta-helix repeat protein